MRTKLLSKLMLLLTMMFVGVGTTWGATMTGTIRFGNNNVKINAASVTGNDDLNNSWTITTEGTTSFTQAADYSQVGSANKPATSITFTTTLPASQTITSMSATFGGFSGTAGTITLKVGNTTVGTGSLNGRNNVTVNSTSSATGTVLTVTVTGISKGVACYNISYSYEDENGTPVMETVATPTFSPEAGSVASGTVVTISSTTAGATIYYTTNGDNPTTNSTQGTSVTINEETTIKAIAVKSGMNNSAVATATYTIAKPKMEEIDLRGITTPLVFNAGDFTASGSGYGSYDNVVYTGDNDVEYAGWTLENVMHANNNMQMRKSDGKVTMPKILTDNGFTITVVATTNSVTVSDGVNSGTNELAVNSASADITIATGSKYAVISTITITPNDASILVAPTFSVAEGDYFTAQNVAISCTTSGAVIYYTTDGTDPTAQSTRYTGPITLSTTTTLKAIAVKNGESSEVVSATYTFPTVYANLAALAAETTAGTYYVDLTNAIVTYVVGKNVYMEDATGAIYIYNVANHGLAVGDKITGRANVEYKVYNGLPELTSFSLMEGYTKTEDNTVTPTNVTIAQLTANPASYLSRYVKITDATVTAAFTNKTATISQNGSSINLRNQNSQVTLVANPGSIVDVVGHGSIYNNAAQVALWAQDQITVKEVVKVDPEVSFAHEKVIVKEDWSYLNEITAPADLSFTYSSSDEDVALVANDGSVTGVVAGTAEITVSWEATALYNAGSATYTVEVVAELPTFELVTDASTLNAGDEILIAYVDEETETCMALSTTQNPNNRKATSNVALIEHGILEAGFDAQIITLETGAESTFLFNVGNGYLYAASSGSNWLRTEQEADDNANATIVIKNDTATIIFQGANTRNHLRYNENVQNEVSNPIFSCYAETSTVETLPMIFRKVVDELPGDVNHDDEVNYEDVEVLVSLILYEDTDDACDVNKDGQVSLADVTALVNILRQLNQ